jgi:phosphoserine phosphatase
LIAAGVHGMLEQRMTDTAHDKQVADLTTLLEVSRQLGATIELDPLLKSIERAALKVLDCERASVFLYDQTTNELVSKVATGVEELRFPADQGIAGEAAKHHKMINVMDAYADPRFNPSVDRATGFKTRNMLTFSMEGYDGQLMGVLQLLNKKAGSFCSEDEQLADTLSALAGVAIQRQFLLEEYAEKQKLERDLDLARSIQQGYLPKDAPQIAGFDIAGWNQPADQTGGDAYDFMQGPDGQLGLLIADATGHGVGPALMVAECRALIRALSSTTDDLGVIMSRTNAVLADDLQEGRFVTACFAFLNPADSKLKYLSAGHGPLIRYRADRDEFEELSANALPLGIIENLSCERPPDIDLAAGDFFILITDGFFEWARPDGQQFGMERMYRTIRANRELPCAEIIQALHHAVVKFGEGTPQLDDLTAIFIRKT